MLYFKELSVKISIKYQSDGFPIPFDNINME